MSARLQAEVRAGNVIPGIIPRVAGVAVSCVAFILVPFPAAVVAVAFAVIAALIPASLGMWGAAIAIGLGQLAHTAGPGDWRSYGALAVVHLLHVIGGLAMVVDPRGNLQVQTLRRPLLRGLWIQLPAQAVLAVVLVVPHIPLVGETGTFAVIGAVCLCAAAVLLVRLAASRR